MKARVRAAAGAGRSWSSPRALVTAEPLQAVGLWYQDFPQMTDEEVRDLVTT